MIVFGMHCKCRKKVEKNGLWIKGSQHNIRLDQDRFGDWIKLQTSLIKTIELRHRFYGGSFSSRSNDHRNKKQRKNIRYPYSKSG